MHLLMHLGAAPLPWPPRNPRQPELDTPHLTATHGRQALLCRDGQCRPPPALLVQPTTHHHTPPRAGLEKAIEARRHERSLCKYRDQNGMAEMINADLTYAVDFNLAHMHHLNKNYKEAVEMFTGALAACGRPIVCTRLWAPTILRTCTT